RKFLRWANDNMAAFKSAKPRMPDGFFGRLEENYHLLFAIAELAGGDWPKKAHAAAIKLSRTHGQPSLGKQLLAIFFDLSIRHGTLLMRARHQDRVGRLPRSPSDGLETASAIAELRSDLIAAEREFIYRLLREGKITDEARRRIERELDLEE